MLYLARNQSALRAPVFGVCISVRWLIHHLVVAVTMGTAAVSASLCESVAPFCLSGLSHSDTDTTARSISIWSH